MVKWAINRNPLKIMPNTPLIKPLTLGNRTFPVNLIQGPLAGVSNAPFRWLAWQQSEPAFTCTEMISCKTLIHKPHWAKDRFLTHYPGAGPLCVQLSANQPYELAEATKLVTDHGVDIIDLNCGCPVRKIRNRGAGSKHLSSASILYKFIRTMKDNTHLPVSVKIRVDGDSSDNFNTDIANMLKDSDINLLTVHGRHWRERYDVACRFDEIAFFKQALSIPVIGNGDVACLTSLKRMFETGCDGIMIGRSGVGQPWLIRKLIAEMNGESFYPPSPEETAKMLLYHVELLIEFMGNEKFAILQARKLAKYYARSISHKEDFCRAMNDCEDFQNLKKLCQQYFIDKKSCHEVIQSI